MCFGAHTRVVPMRRPLLSLRRDRRTPVPFVVGVTRSGTTLLRLMLDAHPELAIPPETHFVPGVIELFEAEPQADASLVHETIVGERHWGDFNLDSDQLRARLEGVRRLDASSALRAFYELYAEREGKPRWGDKTPQYLKRMLLIQRALPEVRFVHLIRDGRDAALSRSSRLLKEPPPMELVGERWRKRILRARRNARRLPHYMEARYEDLVTDTEPTLVRICDFLAIDFDPAMLEYHTRAADRLAEMARDLPSEEGKPLRPAEHRMEAHLLTSEPPTAERVARWKREMTPADALEGSAGELLSELGYELSGSPGPS
jgi:Sulfotransferase family